ncbi:hypothetical protein D3C85_953250 [compost metagenome]
MPRAHVDQHAAVGLGHGADFHLLGELADRLITLIEQHQVLFRRALGADDGLVQIVDAAQQAVHPVRLVPYGGVDGVALLVELGGEGVEALHHAVELAQGGLAPAHFRRRFVGGVEGLEVGGDGGAHAVAGIPQQAVNLEQLIVARACGMVGGGIPAHLSLGVGVDDPLAHHVARAQSDGIGVDQGAFTYIALAVDVHYVVAGGLQQPLLGQHTRSPDSKQIACHSLQLHLCVPGRSVAG